MKQLLISLTLAGCVSTAMADDLSKAMLETVPAVKETSKDSYRRLHAGFSFKGYGDSPGHQAVLAEMKVFYKHLQSFETLGKQAAAFPETQFKSMKGSLKKVEKLSGFIVMEKEVKQVLDTWLASANKFTGSRAVKETEVKVKQVEEKTKKLEKAIKREEKKQPEVIDPKLEAKEARLQALQDHYRFLQKQNRAIIRAGYTTPALRSSGFSGGYYYNSGNHTYYPNNQYRGHYNSSNYCLPYRSGTRVNIIYRR